MLPNVICSVKAHSVQGCKVEPLRDKQGEAVNNSSRLSQFVHTLCQQPPPIGYIPSWNNNRLKPDTQFPKTDTRRTLFHRRSIRCSRAFAAQARCRREYMLYNVAQHTKQLRLSPHNNPPRQAAPGTLRPAARNSCRRPRIGYLRSETRDNIQNE